LQQKLAVCIGIAMLCLLGRLSAQPIEPGQPGMAVLPPHEIIALVRSTGFEPLNRPVRHAAAYTLRAFDAAAQEVVQLTVDARKGRIVRIVPITGPRASSMPHPVPPERIVPDGGGLNSRMATFPPDTESPEVAPRTTHALETPPLPRPRPKEASVAPSTTVGNGSTDATLAPVQPVQSPEMQE
jgi:hypothetical protein